MIVTPSRRDRVYRALVALGMTGSTSADISAACALSVEIVNACLLDLARSGMVGVNCGTPRRWRPSSRSVSRSVHDRETANSAKAAQLNTR